MKRVLLFIAAVCLLPGSTSGGIGIAVARDKNGSSIRWHVAWVDGPSYKADRIATKRLKDKGNDRVYNQPGGEEQGHDLDGGYLVVVESTRRSDGERKTSFGLGASSRSYSQAESRAVKNLSTHDWGWSKKHGYKVAKRGKF